VVAQASGLRLEFGHSRPGNPKGLPDGSRGSPRVSWGGDLRVAAHERPCTPAGCKTRCCRACSRLTLLRRIELASCGWVWHPCPGCWTIRHAFPVVVFPLALNDHRLPSDNPPGWPTLPSSVEDVQTPGASLRLAKSAKPLGWPGRRRARIGIQQARGSLGLRKPEAYATTGWWRCRDVPSGFRRRRKFLQVGLKSAALGRYATACC
jgi:hypothetical protein